jgi:hypothetical protein
MIETGRDDAPGKEGAISWADETLPLGLRRELLDRELQAFIANKNRARSATPSREAERAPNGERPAAGKRGGGRPG